MDLEPRDLVLALKAKGFTQKQIQAETGIPQPTISKIERGDSRDVMSRNYRALVAMHAKVAGEMPAPAPVASAEAASAAG
ncbi:helix-turn-helix domain-containing protein [Acidovorax sp. NCPPB 3576]|uniref:helix-turn-helix domain-containing protein n=1 Tax=Acidovorax sp. NCPPB 3576 TaxID=2940488 RepID=UPI0023490EB9|nr:helix-turn-helix domain-containing protein [Acidovorax sp. NCPPB 3576]WCM88823.1 helix-turn-helix domain-containing protein [Acidovorax sp. NCPPB 3576]